MIISRPKNENVVMLSEKEYNDMMKATLLIVLENFFLQMFTPYAVTATALVHPGRYCHRVLFLSTLPNRIAR